MDLRGGRGLAGGQDIKIQGLGFGVPSTGTPVSSIITAVRQQDYSASVWLRRKEKLEHVSSEYQTGEKERESAQAEYIKHDTVKKRGWSKL